MVFELLILTDHLLIISDADLPIWLFNFIFQLLILDLIFSNLSLALDHDTEMLRGPFQISDTSSIWLGVMVRHLFHDDLYDLFVVADFLLKLSIESLKLAIFYLILVADFFVLG